MLQLWGYSLTWCHFKHGLLKICCRNMWEKKIEKKKTSHDQTHWPQMFSTLVRVTVARRNHELSSRTVEQFVRFTYTIISDFENNIWWSRVSERWMMFWNRGNKDPALVWRLWSTVCSVEIAEMVAWSTLSHFRTSHSCALSHKDLLACYFSILNYKPILTRKGSHILTWNLSSHLVHLTGWLFCQLCWKAVS